MPFSSVSPQLEEYINPLISNDFLLKKYSINRLLVAKASPTASCLSYRLAKHTALEFFDSSRLRGITLATSK